MDRKTVAIVVLTLTAFLLTGVAVNGLLPPDKPAYAQAGRLADYAMLPVAISNDTEVLCIIDTDTQRMLFFRYQNGKNQLEVVGKNDLKTDFGRPTTP